jgi:hypothetical protein
MDTGLSVCKLRLHIAIETVCGISTYYVIICFSCKFCTCRMPQEMRLEMFFVCACCAVPKNLICYQSPHFWTRSLLCWAIPPGAGSSWRWRGRGREREKLDRRPFSLSFQGLSFVDWRPEVKGRGVGKLTEVSWWLLKPQAVTLRLVYWYERDLGAVGLTGGAESSLHAPSSSADVRVCKQNWVWFWGAKFGLEFGWVTRRLAGGRCPGTLWGRCGVRRAGFRGWLRYVCVCVFYVESLWWFIL